VSAPRLTGRVRRSIPLRPDLPIVVLFLVVALIVPVIVAVVIVLWPEGPDHSDATRTSGLRHVLNRVGELKKVEPTGGAASPRLRANEAK
jgi:hypothetical protein